jgi:hypothetical protein
MEKRFDAVPPSPTEQEKRTGFRVHLQLFLNDGAQSVYRLAHIGVAADYIDLFQPGYIA